MWKTKYCIESRRKTIKERQSNCTGHIWRRTCLLQHIPDGKIDWKRKWGRRCKQLPADLKEKRIYWNLKEKTYVLTPWCRVLLEKLTGLQLVKKFPAFHGTRRFITVLTSFRHLSLSLASPIQSIYPHPTYWRSILILSTHLRLGLPSGLFPSGFPTKTLYTPSPHPYAPHAQLTEWKSMDISLWRLCTRRQTTL